MRNVDMLYFIYKTYIFNIDSHTLELIVIINISVNNTNLKCSI